MGSLVLFSSVTEPTELEQPDLDNRDSLPMNQAILTSSTGAVTPPPAPGRTSFEGSPGEVSVAGRRHDTHLRFIGQPSMSTEGVKLPAWSNFPNQRSNSGDSAISGDQERHDELDEDIPTCEFLRTYTCCDTVIQYLSYSRYSNQRFNEPSCDSSTRADH